MMTPIQEQLFTLRDEKYAAFQAKLTPTVSPDKFIGVRVPALRKMAKQLIAAHEENCILDTLPHDYYEEYLLHSLLLSEMKDYNRCIEAIDTFLPYIDNWAVCDTLVPKVFKKHKDILIDKIWSWMSSNKTYTCRFGTDMLMHYYLEDNFRSEYLEKPASIISDEYYVNMMTAWFFATALAKQWDATIIYIEQNKLPIWVHNKTIQKAIESYRISDEQKGYLRTLKRVKK